MVPFQLLSFFIGDPDLRSAFHAWSPDMFSIAPGRLRSESVPGVEHLAKPKAATRRSPLQQNISNRPFSRPFERSVEVASARLDAIRATNSPAFQRTSISIPKSDGCVYGSGCTR